MVIDNIQQAVSILIQAAQIGQSKGSYNLNESRLIADAIDFLVPPTEDIDAKE